MSGKSQPGIDLDKSNIKGVIIDAGGVILNIENIKSKTKTYFKELFPYLDYFNYLKRLRKYKDKAQTIRDYSMKDAVFDTFASYKREGIYLDNEKIKKFYELTSNIKPDLNPYALPLLKEFKKKNLTTCLLSDTSYNREEAKKFFNTLDEHLLNYLDCIILSKEIGFKKPSKEILDYTISKVKIKPANLIFITDALDEVIGTKKYGFGLVVSVYSDKEDKNSRSTEKYADYRINRLEEIIRIMRSK